MGSCVLKYEGYGRSSPCYLRKTSEGGGRKTLTYTGGTDPGVTTLHRKFRDFCCINVVPKINVVPNITSRGVVCRRGKEERDGERVKTWRKVP